jgi:hypothetical protein
LCFWLELGNKRGMRVCRPAPSITSISTMQNQAIHIPATVQGVRRWFLSAEPLVQCRVTSCEIRGDRSGMFQRPLEVCDAPVRQHINTSRGTEPALAWSHSTVSSAGLVDTRGYTHPISLTAPAALAVFCPLSSFP